MLGDGCVCSPPALGHCSAYTCAEGHTVCEPGPFACVSSEKSEVLGPEGPEWQVLHPHLTGPVRSAPSSIPRAAHTQRQVDHPPLAACCLLAGPSPLLPVGHPPRARRGCHRVVVASPTGPWSCVSWLWPPSSCSPLAHMGRPAAGEPSPGGLWNHDV